MKPASSLIKQSFGYMALAGLFVCLFNWVIEAAIHSYVLHEGPLGSLLFSSTSHRVSIWFINSIFFIGLGVYAKVKLDESKKKQAELKFSRDELGDKLTAISEHLDVQVQSRQEAESALRQEELKFRALFDHISDGILIADAATKKFVEVNRAMCETLGYAREDVLDLGIKDIHPLQDLPAVLAAFERVVRNNEKVAENLPVMKKDGTVFYADIGHTTVSLNNRPCAVGIFRDVTERRRSEDRLRSLSKRLEFLVSSSPAIIYTCRYGGDWAVTFVSDNLKNVLGYDVNKYPLSPGFWVEGIHPDDRERVLAGLSALGTTGFHDDEYRFRHKDGSYRWMHDKVHIICDDQGKPVECVGSWMDITERKQAEEALHLSEKRYQSIIEDQSELICRYMPDGRLSFVNGAYARYYGALPKDLLGRNFIPNIPEPDLSLVLDRIRKIAPDTPIAEFEHRVIIPDGAERWQRWTHRGIYTEDGIPIEYQAVGRDITDRKLAEEALRESEERLKEAQSIAKIGNWEYEASSGRLWWSDEVYRMLGFGPGDVLPSLPLFLEMVHPDDREELRSQIEDALPFRSDYRICLHDGTEKYFHEEVEVALGENAKPNRFWGIFQDITERKRTEKELNLYRTQLEAMVEDRTRDLEITIAKLKTEVRERKRAEDTVRRNSALLRGVFEGIQDGIALVDADQNIIMVNHAVERFFHSEGLTGFKTKKCYEVFRQSREICDNCAAVRAIKEKTTQVEKISFKKRGEGERLLEHYVFPLYDEHGEVRAVIHYLRDITEKTMLEERARRSDHLAALGQISAGIAHEINNPNQIIMANSELLKDVWHDADSVLSEYCLHRGDFLLGGLPFSEMQPRVDAMISRILNGSVRIKMIVDSMQEYAYKMQPGYTEKVNINDVVRACIERLKERIGKTTDAFNVNLSEDIPLVTGNRQALEVVITNLVSNSLQALADRTKGISFITRHDWDDNSVILEVRDEGTGMTDEVLKQVLNPFFTTRQGSGGTGLGLSIAHSIIKNHNGSIDLASKPGQGTVATVRLPAID